jgi:hypothetical protein
MSGTERETDEMYTPLFVVVPPVFAGTVPSQ